MEAAGGDSQRLWSETVGRRKKRNDEWWNLAAVSNIIVEVEEWLRDGSEGLKSY